MKISRKEKKYVKSLMAPEIPCKIYLKNGRQDPEDSEYYIFDIIAKGRIIGDAIFYSDGKYETGSWTSKI